jgi:hypothetical protein
MGGALPPLPQCAFMAWCSVGGSTGMIIRVGAVMKLSWTILRHNAVFPWRVKISVLRDEILLLLLTNCSNMMAYILMDLGHALKKGPRLTLRCTCYSILKLFMFYDSPLHFEVIIPPDLDLLLNVPE